ncbi:MAG: hypothetical protein V1682_00380, partial [Candidatus Omnitrophota bacterium]
MRMRQIFAVIMAAALALAGSAAGSLAYDQYGSKAGKDLVGKFCHKVAFIMEHEKDIALTEEQVKSVEDIKLKTKKELIKAEADIDVVGIDIEQALHQDNIDVPATDALIDKQYDLKRDKAKVLAASFAGL